MPNGRLEVGNWSSWELDMQGVLVIDKPSGPTSHDVVARVRRAVGISRIGHTGTLDPLATGVLPLVVGRATRLAQFLSATDKEYIADIRIGFTSETYDAEGPLVPTRLGPLTRLPEPIDSVLAEFRGTYWQMPPPYSAKKVGGTPAYKLARHDKPVELKPVRVTVHALDVDAIDGDLLRVRVVCSAGFYVRTLAHDIGERLGCGAYLAGLRRTRVGAFTLAAAVPLDEVERRGPEAALGRLIPLEGLLTNLPAVILGDAGARRVAHGNAVTLEHLAPGSTAPGDGKAGDPPWIVRLLDASGTLLAIAEWRTGSALHPMVVLV
jgi:tRNA pseudouridine55 synthase